MFSVNNPEPLAVMDDGKCMVAGSNLSLSQNPILKQKCLPYELQTRSRFKLKRLADQDLSCNVEPHIWVFSNSALLIPSYKLY